MRILFYFLINLFAFFLILLYKRNIKKSLLFIIMAILNVSFVFFLIFRFRLSISALYFFIFFFLFLFLLGCMFFVTKFFKNKIEANAKIYEIIVFREPLKQVFLFFSKFRFFKKFLIFLTEITVYLFCDDRRILYPFIFIPSFIINLSLFLEILITDQLYFSLFLFPWRFILPGIFTVCYEFSLNSLNDRMYFLFQPFSKGPFSFSEFVEERKSVQQLKMLFPFVKILILLLKLYVLFGGIKKFYKVVMSFSLNKRWIEFGIFVLVFGVFSFFL